MDLESCLIFKTMNANCNKCGCPIRNHTHAKLEYFTVKKETEAYKLLVANLANVNKSSSGQVSKINFVAM